MIDYGVTEQNKSRLVMQSFSDFEGYDYLEPIVDGCLLQRISVIPVYQEFKLECGGQVFNFTNQASLETWILAYYDYWKARNILFKTISTEDKRKDLKTILE